MEGGIRIFLLRVTLAALCVIFITGCFGGRTVTVNAPDEGESVIQPEVDRREFNLLA